jgi:aspartate/methionine/tyrosine aminotransferase
MRFDELQYLSWAKSAPRVAINLARSGIDHCPARLLGLRAADLVTSLPVTYGYAPLLDAIARRYDVTPGQVLTLSGGTSFANYIACAAALDGQAPRAEVIVERPTYEPLWRIPRTFGHRVRRLDRRFSTRYAIDLDRFASLINPRTRLAIVSNLHNPSGMRIPMATLRRMASMLARVNGYLLVDEVYLECLFRAAPESCVHAGPNVIVTNSLTKAYGLDGLRAGWILGPKDVIQHAGRINDYLTNNGVAPGEQMALQAFRRHRVIDRRAHAILDGNLDRVRRYFESEPRLHVHLPDGGNVAFPLLPPSLDSETFADHLVRKYSTLVVPGKMFEAPRHVRISFGCPPRRLMRGLEHLSRAIDDFEGSRGPKVGQVGRGLSHMKSIR